jgi:hypothetical protein
MIIAVMLAGPMINGLMAVMPPVLRFQPVTTRLAEQLQLEPGKLLAVLDIIVLAVIKLLAEQMRSGLMALTPLVSMLRPVIILQEELQRLEPDRLNVRPVHIALAELSPELVRLVIIVRPAVLAQLKLLAVLEPLIL